MPAANPPADARDLPRAALLAGLHLILLLPLIGWLRATGVTDLSFFGLGPSYALDRLPWLLPALLILFVLKWFGPSALKPYLTLIGGLGCGAIAYPLYLIPLLLLSALSWAIIHFVGARIAPKMIALAAMHLALGAASWWANAPWLSPLAVVFVLMSFFKTLQYLQEMIRYSYARRSLAAFWAYLFAAPNWLIHPYLVVIPTYHPPRRPRSDAALLSQGVVSLWRGVAFLIIARLMAAGLGALTPANPEGLWQWHLWSMADMLVLLTYAASGAGMLIGLLNLLGHDVKPAFKHPWFARSLFDYWNRFIIHYKDLQVALLYFPTVLTLRKKGQSLAVLAGVFVTFMIGNNLFHLLGRYLYTEELMHNLPHAIMQNIALTVVMGGALLWEEHKARRPRRPSDAGLKEGWAQVATQVYLTLAVVSWIWHL